MTYEEEALARTAIARTMSIYNTSGDRGRFDELLGSFTPDGVLEVPGARHEGRDAIRDFMNGVGSSRKGPDLSGARHHLTTSRIEFKQNGDAESWTYFYVMRRGKVIQEGTYIDIFTRARDRWLIAQRRVKIVWTEGDAA